ncbi:MAG: ATP-binding protein [Gaiellaceae bacterium]|jgi:signal transduction histidine kinase
MATPDRITPLAEAERWLGWVRLAAVPFAAFQVGFSSGYPPGYLADAWLTTLGFGVGAVILFVLSRRVVSARLALAGLIFDSAVVSTYVLVYSFEQGTPIRQLLYLPIVEGALLYGIAGSVAVALATAPVAAVFEWLRSRRVVPRSYHLNFVTFQVGTGLLMALIVGWLVLRLRGARADAEVRVVEAEQLRDQLGRRVDLLEAANRAARALGSSLDLDEAFKAFIRELSALMPFARVTIVLVEGERAEVMATAGRGADAVFPPGSVRPVGGSILDELLEGKVVYRETMRPPGYPEEEKLLELGLECRLLAPLQVGPRTIGMLGVMREEPHAFSDEDVELAALLGRLVATAVQNIRAYDAERKTVDELRRLSALRADFVSLVSHELRSPMAAVIGAARTLQGRWRELSPDQRQSFLALIGDETTRLADLIGDVLDTSRIEAGTFSYSFRDVDVARIVRDVVTSAQVGQDEVRIVADVSAALPPVRGDAERLRQVLDNLVDNAVKYSPGDGEVRVVAHSENGNVRVDVRDRGLGIPPDDQRLIFEKFGRSSAGETKPGTGLGLFIARSIAEAHGGSIELESAPDRGATFTLLLPAGGPSVTSA